MWWKAILLYSTFITITIFIFNLDHLSVWLFPCIMLIIIEFILCNKYITWKEAKMLLLIYDQDN
jgi:hypothetical protein